MRITENKTAATLIIAVDKMVETYGMRAATVE